ncbi:MFS transporter [Paenibacillus koleovorans]|uniref:MFS transporter n=1 Tax=Paenibacillus koleovorans TaxID=121608 RepID=UPI000FD99FCE|nr:MFS transporter [Paenibacillus koleovorans]
MNKLIWLGCLSYFLIGLAHTVVGPVMEPLISHYGVSYSDGGQLVMHQFLGFLAGVLLSPWMIGQLGRRSTILLATAALTIAETVYSFLPDWSWMLAVAPLAGFGFGTIESVIGATILAVITEKRASVMSRLEVFFGVGALVMPGVAAILVSGEHWRWAFPFVAVWSALTMLLWLLPSIGKRTLETPGQENLLPAANEPVSPSQTKYSRPMLGLVAAGALFFFLYVGTEMSLAHYLPSILHLKTGLSESAAAWSVSLFWAAMAVGRFIITFVADRIRYSVFLLLTSTGTAAVCMLLALAGRAPASLVLIVVLGLIMAGMFSMGLVYWNNSLPGTSDRTTSILVAAGGLGGALLPKGSGAIMDIWPSNYALWLMAASSLLMLLIMATAIRLARRVLADVPAGDRSSRAS